MDALVDRAFSAPTAKSWTLLSIALFRLRETDHERFVRVARAALEGTHENLHVAVGHALSCLSLVLASELELAIVAEGHVGSRLRRQILRRIGEAARDDEGLRQAALDALAAVEVRDEATAESLCAAIAPAIGTLPADRLPVFVSKLVVVDRLDDYHVGEFLTSAAQDHPETVLKLLLARLAEQAKRRTVDDYGYQATPDQLRGHDFSGLRRAASYQDVLREIRDVSKETSEDVSAVRDLFWRIGAFDDPTLAVLDEWLHESRETIALLVGFILDAPDPLALRCPTFVLHACTVASALGLDLQERIESALVQNAMPRGWSGTPGAIPPVFLEIAEKARVLDQAWAASGTVLFRRIRSEAIRQGEQHAQEGREILS